ncbi:putative ribonuclease H-like domain-containing protein [Tanacetum coccineum]
MDNTIAVSPIPTLKIHKDHPKGQILGDPTSAVQTRGKIQKASSAQQALVSYIHKQNRTNHKDHQNCLFACFLSQEEPKTISQALQDESWVEAMQEELLQFKLQKVWVLVDLPSGKKVIGTKWVFRNKRDERSIVVKNKARLIGQGFRQEEGIDYDEVFALVARIEAIRLFLAFASYMGFTVYQMDVKSDLLYGTIEEEVYVHQPPGFVDPAHPNKVYKVIKALYGLHQAPRAWYETLSSFFDGKWFQKRYHDHNIVFSDEKSDIMLVQVYVDDIIFGSTKKSMCTEFEELKQQPDGIFISQDKYVADILKKFDFLSIKTATTPIESNKPLVKDEDGVDIDVHDYRDSPFELEAYSDSDYGGASLDRKSTTSGCQFLRRRLISWQCKKQTIMANSTTEAEYVAAANCCGQVLWIQNQIMDYCFNFMNTKIHIDNESTISVIKNLVAHSRTKHIEIRFHFIRDCYEKRLIEVIKIHTDSNVADLLTKGFDVTRFNFLVFWTTAKSRTVNNTSYMDVIVAGKPVTISEASIRSDLLFDDVDGIDSLTNQNGKLKRKEMLAEEEATKAALSNEYDFIQARLNADKILAEELQKEEREKFTIEQREKFLHDTIAAQWKFLCSKRVRRYKEQESSSHVKMIARKRPRPQPDDDSDDEHRKCLRIVTFKGIIDSEIIETKSFISRLHKVSSPDGNYLIVYRVNGHFKAFNYLMEVLHIFDRQDLFHLYDLVMKQYSKITPEDIELILWEDLKIMMESSIEENDQELKDGTVIYMLVERRYPLSNELLQQILDLGLEVEEESTVVLQLQMTFGKDKSNPLIVDSLLKTIRLSIHLVVYNEELAIPEQTATGKGISNPLMAGSLPKTTKPT